MLILGNQSFVRNSVKEKTVYGLLKEALDTLAQITCQNIRRIRVDDSVFL
jgi:hypothetical protein